MKIECPENNYINLSESNLSNEHLSCIIRSRKIHQGVENKRAWLNNRLKEGHVFRKLDIKKAVFIEYAPLEIAWVPIRGENYYYIYCLWCTQKGMGYAKSLMTYCIKDAKANGKSGICMLGSLKQKAWLSNQAFAKKYGFEVVDRTASGYEVLALSFDGKKAYFNENAKKETIPSQDLTIYFDDQCPYTYDRISSIKEYCELKNIALSLIQVSSLEMAKNLPCAFNNWALFYKGKFITLNLLDVSSIEKILKKY